jgi:hypothetical protein
MRIIASLGLLAMLELGSYSSQAIGLPLVISATVDYAHNTLTINGQNFGSSPKVTLDAIGFPTTGNPISGTQIVANFPSDRAPSSFTPGIYFLTVTFKNQLPTIFAVDIGANGAQGPAGPAGAPGGAGAPGATGPAGPAGPQGLAGPMGPPGATGAAGATGAQGGQGVAGTTGLQGLQGVAGPAGPQGPQGPKGDPGIGSLSCVAPSIYLVVTGGGAVVCQPRFNDNGDGSVTDNQTGLMWEQKIGVANETPNPSLRCGGGNSIHDVNNCYTWSSVDPFVNPDGTLYTDFLATLNSSASLGVCFLNHCDWRIPTLAEFQTIVELTAPGCSAQTGPCIDPAFGPTAQFYWTSTSAQNDVSGAWIISGNFGSPGTDGKQDGTLAARAVRGGH